MPTNRALVALTASLNLAACATAPEAPTPPTEEREAYLGVDAQPLGEHRFVGAQPDADDFAELKAAGIAKVINFRTPPEMDELGFDEPQILADLGIEYVHIPMGGDEYGYTAAQVDALASALSDPDEKVLLHCTIGWRASMVT
ncbi:MAG: sulfur transferase domain-containing protein, partial [Pseudomonadota bacterium]